MRWRQCRHTGEFIPIDESARKHDGVAIHGVFEPFKSPVDGSIISTNKQLRDHNEKNNVVNADEFSPEFYERKAKERAEFYQGKRSTQQIQRDRMEIYETINRLERA